VIKVGLDPGHGGVDPGAIGSGGLCEDKVTLAVGLELSRLLNLNDLAPVLTRARDESVSLERRCDILNLAQCAIAVSIHCNSSGNRSADYVSTFIQAQGGQAERLAIAIQAELVSATGWKNGGVRVQNLHMTRETNMPAVVVEMGFISNPEQERWLKTSESQKKLAEAICKGICVYLGRTYKKGGLDVAGFEGPARVVYKGKTLNAGILEGRTYVELRTIAELLELNIAWDNATKTVTLTERR
jgi:N-acetylmuramoyl-L-alanine amidase